MTKISQTLACPRCGQTALEETTFAEHKLDLCRRCGGLWCEPTDWERDELGPLPMHGRERAEPGHERAPDVMVAGKSGLLCPHCQRPLTILKAGAPPICEIDQCDHCGGIWFDHQEWEHLEALRQWPAELAKLEAPPTSWDWWIQLLLRLPTEFNIRPRRFPRVTVGVITLCTLIFLFQWSTAPEQWVFLATFPSALVAGYGYWSLFTSMFLHSDLLHLLFNMYYLYIVGDNVEDALGGGAYLLFYLACGVLATLVYTATNWDSRIPLVGASGAIAGVMAAYLLLFRKARLTMMFLIWQVKVAAWIWLGSWIALNLLNALITLSATTESGGIAWWAHIGGFVAGLLLIWPLEQRIVRSYPLLQVMRTQGPAARWFQWA